MKRGIQGSRGQAMVEFAIGSTIFFTVLVFAIHFAELGYFSLKVQEAATSAMWDTTAGKLHNIPMGFGGDLSGGAASLAAANAQSRYANFDGRQSRQFSGQRLELYTKGQALGVNCTTGASGIQLGAALVTTLVGTYTENGGVSCSAQADIDSMNFSNSFLEGGNGFFTSAHNATPNVHVCSTGRAVGGSCQGNMSMMLDDWGMAEQAAIPCLMIQVAIPFFPPTFGGLCLNLPYSYAVWLPVLATSLPIPTGGQNMFQGVLGSPSPIYDWAPAVSAAGYESLFLQPTTGETGGVFMGLQFWPTTPGGILSFLSPWYPAAYASRTNCFLGAPC